VAQPKEEQLMSEDEQRPTEEEVEETALEEDETPDFEGQKWHSVGEPGRPYEPGIMR
jgi:hypothetical protein